jgi:hypothetical protein
MPPQFSFQGGREPQSAMEEARMSIEEVYFWGAVTGVAFTQAFHNTLWIIRHYRNKRAAACGVAVPATAEPVAWRFKLRPEGDWHVDEEKPTHPERLHCVEPLYTAAGVAEVHGETFCKKAPDGS